MRATTAAEFVAAPKTLMPSDARRITGQKAAGQLNGCAPTSDVQREGPVALNRHSAPCDADSSALVPDPGWLREMASVRGDRQHDVSPDGNLEPAPVASSLDRLCRKRRTA